MFQESVQVYLPKSRDMSLFFSEFTEFTVYNERDGSTNKVFFPNTTPISNVREFLSEKEPFLSPTMTREKIFTISNDPYYMGKVIANKPEVLDLVWDKPWFQPNNNVLLSKLFTKNKEVTKRLLQHPSFTQDDFYRIFGIHLDVDCLVILISFLLERSDTYKLILKSITNHKYMISSSANCADFNQKKELLQNLSNIDTKVASAIKANPNLSFEKFAMTFFEIEEDDNEDEGPKRQLTRPPFTRRDR